MSCQMDAGGPCLVAGWKASLYQWKVDAGTAVVLLHSMIPNLDALTWTFALVANYWLAVPAANC